jgi:transposase-like protein
MKSSAYGFENVSGCGSCHLVGVKHFLQIPAVWQPPHCPNPNCHYHNGFSSPEDFKRIGYYSTLANPKRIPRFLCKHCRRSFSRQTFSTTYWQKMPHLDRQIFMSIVGCMGNRQLARACGVSHETIARHVARLGRHCFVLHANLLHGHNPFTHVVIDGFESFEYSQFYPMHHHVAVDKSTGFFIYFTDSELRRKGRMTADQRRQREEFEKLLGRPDPKAIEKDMAESIQISLRGAVSATVYSDLHPAYLRSLRRVPIAVTHSKTDSKQHRGTHNPLFEVNRLDMLIRHGSSNHKRETIAYSKRRQSSAERLVIYQVWQNTVKWRSENRPGQTPAMVLGWLDHRLEIEEILSERLFRAHVELPPRWADYYERKVTTRALKRNRRHTLKYAF